MWKKNLNKNLNNLNLYQNRNKLIIIIEFLVTTRLDIIKPSIIKKIQRKNREYDYIL